jgi:hypothetical protein
VLGYRNPLGNSDGDLVARLPVSGATITTPVRSETELGEVLGQLCPEATFEQAEIHEIYVELGRLHGCWSAEQTRLDIAPLQLALNTIGKNLGTVADTLQPPQTGLYEIDDIAIVSRLTAILAANPEIGSQQRAEDLIVSFQRDAARIANACQIAAVDFGWADGKAGRPKLRWHDDFTRLLLAIAHRGGIKPKLGKDRITGVRTGWLVTAARLLETFFDPAMRSSEAEACGKRLDRSRRTIKQQNGQNPSLT